MKKTLTIFWATVLLLAWPMVNLSFGQSAFSETDLLNLQRASAYQLSPDGSELIYAIWTPRGANEKAGGAHREYFRMNLDTKESTSLFSKKEKASAPQYSPDGKYIAYTKYTKGKPSQVWVMPASGGKATAVTTSKSSVRFFRWHPKGNGIAYLCATPTSIREKELKKRGYGFIFYEENLKINEVHVVNFDQSFKVKNEKQILKGVHVWDFEFSSNGKMLAFTSSKKNLIDHKYMFRKIKIVDLASEKILHEVGNVGKLGNYAFQPKDKHLAYASALNINDHSVSQAFSYSLDTKKVTNHTPKKFKGHVSWVAWRTNNELYVYSGEGVYPTLSTIGLTNQKRSVLLNAEKEKVIFGKPLIAANGKRFVFSGNTTTDPSNLYMWSGKGSLKKISKLNANLSKVKFGEQELISFPARDGKMIEGMLMKPVGFDSKKKYPLIVYVHGGPESHHNNGWLSRYSTPGQVMAGKGYLVAYLNYRASTGYGVDYSMEGFGDPAGKEFDDLADGIEYLIAKKGADRARVGMAGGSYGGYASAWFATRYTKYVKAVCMFVGISNVISKRGTTDISYEELYVHSGKPLEQQWEMNLKRSPIYWAHQSKTATLIYGGADDPRVHPTQSLELHRRMKMNNHPAVRLVQYPGEGHGNRKQVGQIDVLHRQIAWLDWYVRDLKPLSGAMPPLDISDSYGLDWKK